jgi:N-acetylmuramoyl-L-alanine amidase
VNIPPVTSGQPVELSRRAVVLGGLGAVAAGVGPVLSAAPAAAATTYRRGDRGAGVASLQRKLAAAGYWCGRADGAFGHLTQQAVWAVQKRNRLVRDGIAGPRTFDALAHGGALAPVGGSGSRVEINLARQLVVVVRSGRTTRMLNTSTGNGRPYTYHGRTYYAITRRGRFTVYSTYSAGWQWGPLGSLYRPMYFDGGIALHGSMSIPPYPDSHGCARLSTAAMDLVWSSGDLKMGSRVLVY